MYIHTLTQITGILMFFYDDLWYKKSKQNFQELLNGNPVLAYRLGKQGWSQKVTFATFLSPEKIHFHKDNAYCSLNPQTTQWQTITVVVLLFPVVVQYVQLCEYWAGALSKATFCTKGRQSATSTEGVYRRFRAGASWTPGAGLHRNKESGVSREKRLMPTAKRLH